MISKIIKELSLGVPKLSKVTADKFNSLLDYQKPITLVDQSIITWDLSKSYNAKVTLAGNRTLRLDQLTAGDYGTLEVIQDNSGSRTLTLPTQYTNKVVNGGAGAVSLTATGNAIDTLTFYYNGSYILWTVLSNFT